MLINGMGDRKGSLRQRFGASLTASAVLAMVLSFSFVAPQPAMAANKDSLDLVVLVDESASLKASDVQAEIRAVASLVARRELSGADFKTQIAIAGFGSSPNAVDEKCSPMIVTTQNIQDLIRCADKVSRRSSVGQHTDFAKAFDYAASVFRERGLENSARAVILLTDGKYDPFGKRSTSGLTANDLDALSSSTATLRESEAQIWPLGFGQVEAEELSDLAKSGAPSNCEAGRDPYAIVADDETLDEYLLEILGATICAVLDPPKEIPYDFEVHPFVNEVTLTARGVDEDPNVVVLGTNKPLCVGEWKRAGDDSLACDIKVAGGDTGTWRITSSGSESDAKPTIETSQSGRVDLRFSQCAANTPVVSVSRIDNSPILWNAQGNFTFPRIVVVDTTSRTELGAVVLSANDRSVILTTAGLEVSEIEVALAGAQAEFVWLTASTDTCIVSAATQEATAPGSTQSGNVDAAPGNQDRGSGFPQWWLILLILLIIGALLWLLRRRSSQGKFPDGTELRQRNVSQNPAATWNMRADLGGMREAHLAFDRNGWLVESDSGSSDLIVRRIRSRSEGDFEVIQVARGSEGSESTEGTRSTYAFSVVGQPGNGISVRNTFIRVDVPEELDELAENEDQ